MGPRRRLIALTVLLSAGLAACTSCKHKEAPPPEESKPPDHHAPNEVAEGKERAFGLPLPRLSRVAARFEKKVHVQSPYSPEDLVNFVRARVKDGKITPGTTETQLADVVPRDDAQKRLTIEVRSIRGGGDVKSEMIVRDTTPPPLEPGLTDEQRWKKAGLTPSGHIADPSQLQ
jgi:hypothetical protein